MSISQPHFLQKKVVGTDTTMILTNSSYFLLYFIPYISKFPKIEDENRVKNKVGSCIFSNMDKVDKNDNEGIMIFDTIFYNCEQNNSSQ